MSAGDSSYEVHMRFDPQSNSTPGGAGDPNHASASGNAGRGGLNSSVAIVIVATAAALGGWIWFQSQGGPSLASATPLSVVDTPPPRPGGSTVLLADGRVMTDGRTPDIVPSDAEVEEESSESVLAFEQGLRMAVIGRHAEAVPHLARAVELDPEFAEARYRLGIAYVMTGDRAAARTEKAALDEIDPNLANLLANLIQ